MADLMVEDIIHINIIDHIILITITAITHLITMVTIGAAIVIITISEPEIPTFVQGVFTPTIITVINS